MKEPQNLNEFKLSLIKDIICLEYPQVIFSRKTHELVAREYAETIEYVAHLGNFFLYWKGFLSYEVQKQLQSDIHKLLEMYINSSFEVLQKIKEEKKIKEKKNLEKRDSLEFFNQPESRADNKLWSQKSYWYYEEAVALSFGKEPARVNLKTLEAVQGKSNFVEEYYKRIELIKRAIESNDLLSEAYYNNYRVKPKDFINWANSIDIDMPEEFIEAFRRVSKRPTYEDLEKQISNQTKNYSVGLRVAIASSDELGYRINDDETKKSQVVEIIESIVAKQPINDQSFFSKELKENIATLIRSPTLSKGGAKKQKKK